MYVKWMPFIFLEFLMQTCKLEANQNILKTDRRPSDWSDDWYGHTSGAVTKSIATTEDQHAYSRSSIPTFVQFTTRNRIDIPLRMGSTDDAISIPMKNLQSRTEISEISSTKDDARKEKSETTDDSETAEQDKIGKIDLEADDKNHKLGNSDTTTAVNKENKDIETVTHILEGINTDILDLNVDDANKGHADNTKGKQVSANAENVDIQAIGSIPVPSLNNTGAPAFQWHVGVYSKKWSPYMQICGGSLVKRDVVVSAAHCFWDSSTGQQPALQFAVAGGKLYRPWSDQHDVHAQHSDISEIILPARFRGSTTSFQDDIAILHLRSPFTYAPGVRPACVDFSEAFDKAQLQAGNLGTVAGWGLTEENGVPSQRLNYLKLPYVDIQDCFAAFDPSFHKYITSDKICAGTQTGKALCRGDSGGGLIFFPKTDSPYLLGVASTAARNETLCNAYTLTTFTHIFAQRSFLKYNIPDIDEECAPRRIVAISTSGPGCLRFCRFTRSWRCRKCCRRTRECCRTNERYHWCKS